MKHFSCDSCGKDLHSDGQDHYTVRMESRVIAMEPPDLTEDDLDDQSDCDSVHEMTLMLEGEFEKEEYSTPRPARLICKDFDFCDECYRRFSADPLGLERVSHHRFSAN